MLRDKEREKVELLLARLTCSGGIRISTFEDKVSEMQLTGFPFREKKLVSFESLVRILNFSLRNKNGKGFKNSLK